MAKKYREIYKQHYGIEFGNDYVVHHIDEDRTNNDISNLILLPIVLHSKYHSYKTMIRMYVPEDIPLDLSHKSMMQRYLQFYYLDQFRDVLTELQPWIEYKHLADMGHASYPMFEKR